MENRPKTWFAFSGIHVAQESAQPILSSLTSRKGSGPKLRYIHRKVAGKDLSLTKTWSPETGMLAWIVNALY